MATFRHPRHSRILVLSACVGILLGIAIWTSGAINRHSPTTQLSPAIINKTSALKIISSSKVPMGQTEVLKVTLQNVSPKNVVSYTYLSGPNAVTNSYAFSDRLFGPSETREEYISYEKLQAGSPDTSSPSLILAAVCFEGGTGDGDPKVIKQLTDELEGIRDQAGRILPLLRKAQKDAESQDDQVLLDLESQISALPIEDNAPQSLDYKSGRRAANQQMARRLKAPRENKNETPGITRKAEVIGNLAACERILARF